MAEKKETKKTTAKKTTTKTAAAKKTETKKAEPKKTTAKKTAKKVEWFEGYPKQNGLFLCKLDGKETILRHTECTINCKHKWATIDSRLPLGKEIVWTGEPMSVEDLDAFIAKKK